MRRQSQETGSRHSAFAHYLPDPIMLSIRFPNRSPLPGCSTGSRLVPERDAKVARPPPLCQTFAAGSGRWHQNAKRWLADVA
jgi:hypothetical protein